MAAAGRRSPEPARPLVGVTGRRWPAAWLGERVVPAMRATAVDVHFAPYAATLAGAGAIPVGLSRDAPVDGVLDRLDGLVFSGGADIDPAAYGHVPGDGLGAIEPERDRWELALLAGALDRGLAVLAICRGLQLVNVAAGGTLVQDVAVDAGDGHPRFDDAAPGPAHRVDFAPGSRCAALYGPSREVNSLHHQVVAEVGEGLVGARLVVTGCSPDGTVEALELEDRPLLAVQWHPELDPRQPEPALTWLVDAASNRTLSH